MENGHSRVVGAKSSPSTLDQERKGAQSVEAFAELNQKGDRCAVYFRYDKAAVEAVKSIPGARFVPADKSPDGPHWTIPLDLTAMRTLRQKFGNELKLGVGIKAWGRAAVAKEEKLQKLS